MVPLTILSFDVKNRTGSFAIVLVTMATPYNPMSIDVADEECELGNNGELGTATINFDFRGERVASLKLRWYDGLSVVDPGVDEPQVIQHLELMVSQEGPQGINALETRLQLFNIVNTDEFNSNRIENNQ